MVIDDLTGNIRLNKLILSKLMLGTVQLGIEGYGIHNQETRVDADAILNRCVQAGINCYDTAYEYGNAEVTLGRFFKNRESPFIVSKLKVDKNLLSESALERQMTERTEAILQRLQIRTLPALMIHDPELLRIYGKRITRVLNKLRTEGLVHRGGVSLGACPDEDYIGCSEVMRDDVYEVVQVPVNLFDRRVIDCGAMEDFGLSGKTVIARSVFLQGLFFHSEQTVPDRLRHAGAGKLSLLRTIASEEGYSVAQLAVSFVRDMPGVHVLVLGAETPDQVTANIALMNGPPLRDSTRERLEDAFRDVQKLLITPSMWNV